MMEISSLRSNTSTMESGWLAPNSRKVPGSPAWLFSSMRVSRNCQSGSVIINDAACSISRARMPEGSTGGLAAQRADDARGRRGILKKAVY